jgi:hypothetical protein
MIDEATGYRRRCDVRACGRPATSQTPAPWQLAWCQVHADLAALADQAHWRWSLAQTLTRDGTLV